MGTEEQPDLTSWKEIAERLQVTVRTAQEWEKQRGLPVRRLPGGGRSRVFMRVSELEAWLDGALADDGSGNPGRVEDPDAATIPDRDRWTASRWIVLAAVLVAAVAVGLWFLLGRARVPARWLVVSDSLVIYDEDDVELWRARFDKPLRQEIYDQRGDENVELVDVNGDGALETLFARVAADKTLTDVLICFDVEGRELWRFVPGREASSGEESFQNIYKLGTFRTVELSDGSTGVVLTALHYLYYPMQAVLLSGIDGAVRSEYWHSGHVGVADDRLAVADLDADGRSELYLAGVSNGYDRATLVVLDLEDMAGASEETRGADQLQHFAPANEIARILFPRSALGALHDYEFNVANNLWVTDELITVSVLEMLGVNAAPVVFYHLNTDFSLDHISFGSGFPPVHERLLEQGRITLTLDEQERLLRDIEHLVTPRSLMPPR